MLYTSKYCSPVGEMLLMERDGALCGLWFEAQKYYMSGCRESVQEKDTPLLCAAAEWLDAYFAGDRPEISSIPLAPVGGEFRRTVRSLLCRIPYGETVTYGELARETAALLKKPHMSAQAVGGAVGHNPVSVIIPCHRVVGADGSLTGYAAGIETKIRLLAHEDALTPDFYIPRKGTAL